MDRKALTTILRFRLVYTVQTKKLQKDCEDENFRDNVGRSIVTTSRDEVNELSAAEAAYKVWIQIASNFSVIQISLFSALRHFYLFFVYPHRTYLMTDFYLIGDSYI